MMVLTLLAGIAEFERAVIRAGQRTAMKTGIGSCGPHKVNEKQTRAFLISRQGPVCPQIAAMLGCMRPSFIAAHRR